MAQNTFINVTVDPAASKKPDRVDHVHTVVTGTAATGDLTVSFDSTKVTSLSILDSLMASARVRAAGLGLK